LLFGKKYYESLKKQVLKQTGYIAF